VEFLGLMVREGRVELFVYLILRRVVVVEQMLFLTVILGNHRVLEEFVVTWWIVCVWSDFAYENWFL
jgi:hypothetical protein